MALIIAAGVAVPGRTRAVGAIRIAPWSASGRDPTEIELASDCRRLSGAIDNST
jgi:hypothetical protein